MGKYTPALLVSILLSYYHKVDSVAKLRGQDF